MLGGIYIRNKNKICDYSNNSVLISMSSLDSFFSRPVFAIAAKGMLARPLMCY